MGIFSNFSKKQFGIAIKPTTTPSTEISKRVFCFVHFNEILSTHKEDRLLGIFMLFLIQILVNF